MTTEVKNDEMMNIVKESVDEILQDLALDAKEFIESTVFSYVDVAVKDFQDTQMTEAAASTSGWVKVRTKLINTGVSLTWTVMKRVVSKVLERAEADK